LGQVLTTIPPKRLIVISLLVSILAGGGLLAAFTVETLRPASQAPDDVARSYFLADFAHDYTSAWQLISDGDKAHKSFEQYLAENATPLGNQSLLFDQLANHVEFSPISIVSSRPEQTVVWARVRYPDLTNPMLSSLIERAASPDTNVEVLSEQLQSLIRTDDLLFTEEERSFNLVDDDATWRVVLHWEGTVTVRLLASTHPDLPWTFYPMESEIQVLPGETIRTSYIAHNNADYAITGKAVHEILPLEYRMYLETVQCFCFTEQTLEAGEEREMPLIFRIDFTLPQGIDDFSNGYTFYTLESFPEMGEAE